MTFAESIANYVIKELKEFDPFIYSTSADRVSIYIHFRKLPGDLKHKLRISNHPERKQYGYKWQIRTDGVEDFERRQYSRYYTNADDLVAAFKRYYSLVETNQLIN
jgi:hypothetical protein